MLNKLNEAISCRALFFIVAFYFGLWTIRIPTIKDQLHTDYVGIGYILATFAFGSILVMIFANEILKKFQLPVEFKKKKSDFVIKNNFKNNSIKKNVKKILGKIL